MRIVHIRSPDSPGPVRYDRAMNKTATLPSRAITLHPCWAWAVAHASKRIENRSWPTKYRGLIYIHAGCGGVKRDDRESLTRRVAHAGIAYPDESSFTRGALVAIADLFDCVKLPDAQLGAWGCSGSWHFLLRDVRPLPRPIPMSGKLGIWHLDHGSLQIATF